jgi:large subunit ribosomal protein L10
MVAAWKIKEIEELSKKITKAKVVGLVDIKGIPSKQFQLMRKLLAGQAEITVAKNSLLTRSLEKAKIKGLESHVIGSMGIILSDLNPSKLNKILNENKISSPAKAGNVAPRDIVIPAGETTLPPGPMIGDLQKAGIKAQIKGGKIVITEDSAVAKAGDRISAEVATVLSRLGVEPIEIGLKMNAAYEGGVIYTHDVLSINEDTVRADVRTAYFSALNVAQKAGIFNKETIKYFLSDANTKALNLAIKAEVFNKETIRSLLSKANKEMLAVAANAPDLLSDEMKAAMAAAPAAPEAEKKEDAPKKEDKATEEDAAAGLASLFG